MSACIGKPNAGRSTCSRKSSRICSLCPRRPYDTARVLYRTVDPDGHIAYLQNFYSVPWQRIGELLPVRVTENELIVYGPDVKEIARHELYPSRNHRPEAQPAGAFPRP